MLAIRQAVQAEKREMRSIFLTKNNPINGKKMNKRIRRSTRVEDGHIIHIAEVQVKAPAHYFGVWITAKVIEDPCKQYVEARAEEVLEYLEDERYA